MAEKAHSAAHRKHSTADTTAERDEHTEAAATAPSDFPARIRAANEITRRNTLWAMGAGVLPIPIVDTVALLGVHVKMLKELSNLYGVKFSEGLAKKGILSLVSSIGSLGIGTLLGASFAKFIPVLGSTLGFLTVPAITGAATHAVGRVYTTHFESGGTMLDFDAAKMRKHFKNEFEDAKEMAAQLQRDREYAQASK